MKPILFFVGLASVALAMVSCETTKDVTSKPGSKTDFAAGQTYRVKQPVFLFKSNRADPKETPKLAEMGFGGTSTDLAEFRKRALNAPQVAGILIPGEQVRVTKFIEESSPTLGTFFEVFAVVVSGDHAGTIVELNLISKEAHPTHEAHVNPEYLKVVQ